MLKVMDIYNKPIYIQSFTTFVETIDTPFTVMRLFLWK